jgi:mannan endo-1,6-alpha-mannosidase
VLRWDSNTCKGGLRWQIFTFNSGYDYKNAAANGNFFHLAARLAKYTGNQTYADWANTTYTWMENVGLLTSEGSVFDGAFATSNCSALNRVQWSQNAGFMLYGSALMYNVTGGSKIWSDRVSTILNSTTSIFFKEGIISETACETNGKCDIDQRFYKGNLARDMARTAKVAPFTASIIQPLLKSSAAAAASTGCTNSNGSCAFNWLSNEGGSGPSDLGTQFSALEVIQSILVPSAGALATTNGTASNSSTNGGQNSPKSSGSSSLVEVKIISWVYLGLTLLATNVLLYTI